MVIRSLICLCFFLLSLPKFVAIDLMKCDGRLQEGEPVYTNGRHCFMFDTDLMSWDEAERACQFRHGYLLQTPDTSTYEFIIQTVPLVGWSQNSFWIGVTDRVTEGDWRWTNGDEVIISNWAKGCPKRYRRRRFIFDEGDTFREYSATISDCVVVNMKESGKWRDQPCNKQTIKHPFICQFDVKHRTEPVQVNLMTLITSLMVSSTLVRKEPTLATTLVREVPLAATTLVREVPTAATTLVREVSTAASTLVSEEPTSANTLVNEEPTANIQTVQPSISGKMIDYKQHLTSLEYSYTVQWQQLKSNTTDIPNSPPQDEEKENGQTSFKLLGLVIGMSVVGVMTLSVIISSILVCNRLKSRQRIILKDVMAFNNDAYTNTDDTTIQPQYHPHCDVVMMNSPCDLTLDTTLHDLTMDTTQHDCTLDGTIKDVVIDTTPHDLSMDTVLPDLTKMTALGDTLDTVDTTAVLGDITAAPGNITMDTVEYDEDINHIYQNPDDC